MASSLWVSRAEIVGNSIFFLTEENGYPGIIDISTGEVVFLSQVPKDIIGHPAHDFCVFTYQDHVDIVSNYGEGVYRYDISNSLFEELYAEKKHEKKMIGSCAGAYRLKDECMIFTRDGMIVTWNSALKKITRSFLMKDKKVCWADGSNNDVWLLESEALDLYRYDVISKKCELYSSNILKGYELLSRSWLPVHHMKVDSKMIYLHDSTSIYSFDIERKRTDVVFRNEENDNGSRLIFMENDIVITPYYGREFIVLDKQSGTLKRKEMISEEILGKTSRQVQGGVVGGISEGLKCVYMPLTTRDDYILKIEDCEKCLSTIKLNLEHLGKKNLITNLIKKDGYIKESSYASIGDFLEIMEV